MTGIAAGIARWLRENQQPDGRIRDPLHGECGTYSAGCAALAFGLMARRTGAPEWEAVCLRSVEYARRRPVESEFDSFALLLLAAQLREAGAAVPPSLATLDSRLSTHPLYQGNRLVSNNWVAMRALSYTLRAHLTGCPADRREADGLWERVRAWQEADGLFVDSPGGDAAPVTYHAKFCAMLLLAEDFTTETQRHRDRTEDAEVRNQDSESPALSTHDSRLTTHDSRLALRQSLEALSALVSPSGVLVPYGRSRNTLFGHAAALLALRRGARRFHRPDWAAAAERIAGRLRACQRADGHIPCVLNDGEAVKRDWDVYVNNPDYNAYAAALLLLAGEPGPQAAPVPGPTGVETRRIGPLLTVRRGGLFAAFALEGRSVPIGTPFFCDHRYYGMQPLWIQWDGRPLLEPALYTWKGGEDRAALVDPTANPWLPCIEARGRRYAVRRYDHVEVRVSGDTVEMEGKGVPEAYLPVPRWERGVRGRWAAQSGSPSPVFRVRLLKGARLRVRLVLDVATGHVCMAAEPVGALPSGAVLRSNRHES